MSGWNSPWNVNLGDVIAQAAESASALKDNIERTMDEALQGDDDVAKQDSKEAMKVEPQRKAISERKGRKKKDTDMKNKRNSMPGTGALAGSLDFFGDFGINESSAGEGKGIAAFDTFAKHFGISTASEMSEKQQVDTSTTLQEGEPLVPRDSSSIASGSKRNYARETEGNENIEVKGRVEMESDVRGPFKSDDNALSRPAEDHNGWSEGEKEAETEGNERLLKDNSQEEVTSHILETKNQRKEAGRAIKQEILEEQTPNLVAKEKRDLDLEMTSGKDRGMNEAIDKAMNEESEHVEISKSLADQDGGPPTSSFIEESKRHFDKDTNLADQNPGDRNQIEANMLDFNLESSDQKKLETNSESYSKVTLALASPSPIEKDTQIKAPNEAFKEEVNLGSDQLHQASDTIKVEKAEHRDVSGLLQNDEGKVEEGTLIELKTVNENLRSLIAERERQLEVSVRRCAAVTEELDALKDENASLKEHQNQLESRLHAKDSNAKKIVQLEKEKEELKIRAEESDLRAESLMEEGLELSKKQGNLETALRKAKKDLSEEKKQIGDLKTTNTKLRDENEELKRELEEAKEIKARGEKSMAEISESSVETKRKLQELELQLKTSMSHEASLQASLDASWQDLADQKKSNKLITLQLKAARSEVEQLRHQLKEQINSVEMRNDRAATMERSVTDAHQAIQQQQREWEIVETGLREEIKLLQKRLQEQERRNEDLVESSAKATAPLIRQIEALKSVAHMRQNALETTQATLIARAVSAEKNETAAVQAMRHAENERDHLSLKLVELESSIVSLRNEKARLDSITKMTKERADEAENECQNLAAQLENSRAKLDKKLKEIKAAEAKLRKSLLVEQEKHEKETQDLEIRYQREKKELLEKISELESRIKRFEHMKETSKSQQQANEGKATNRDQAQLGFLSNIEFDNNNRIEPESKFNEEAEFDDETSGIAASIQIQRLKSKLNQRIGENRSYKEQLASVERSRDALAEEMVRLSEETQRIRKELNTVPDLQKYTKDLEFKHEVLLGLLGEKEEQMDELLSDLKETKASYKSQIDSLSQQLEVFTNSEPGN